MGNLYASRHAVEPVSSCSVLRPQMHQSPLRYKTPRRALIQQKPTTQTAVGVERLQARLAMHLLIKPHGTFSRHLSYTTRGMIPFDGVVLT